jgi:glyoxylase-like metal-dependent hydrolase (beta-lactamase superfamily II)
LEIREGHAATIISRQVHPLQLSADMTNKNQIPIDPSARADDPETDALRADGTHEVTADVSYQRLALVNVVFYGIPGTRDWVLIDAGIHGSASLIFSAAEERFNAPPKCIVLTHGHFDHVGGLRALVEHWDVPVYAHLLEHPYLNGTASYPPPDPSVGGGLMTRLSPLFPRGAYDFSNWLQPLPLDRSVPDMAGWTWIHTPGHTPGHISLWRASDRCIISGDAFITTRQESAYAVAAQRPELHGPPAYFTQDWDAALESVEHLAALEPDIAVTGHGRAMKGHELRRALHELADNFDIVAVPGRGKYVGNPATPEDGTAYDSP